MADMDLAKPVNLKIVWVGPLIVVALQYILNKII